jgi:hypothetical protein
MHPIHWVRARGTIGFRAQEKLLTVIKHGIAGPEPEKGRAAALFDGVCSLGGLLDWGTVTG